MLYVAFTLQPVGLSACRHRFIQLPVVHDVNWALIKIDLLDKFFALSSGHDLIFKKLLTAVCRLHSEQ